MVFKPLDFGGRLYTQRRRALRDSAREEVVSLYKMLVSLNLESPLPLSPLSLLPDVRLPLLLQVWRTSVSDSSFWKYRSDHPENTSVAVWVECGALFNLKGTDSLTLLRSS